MSDQDQGKIIGIDLGTTYSVVALLDEATLEPLVIPNAEGGNKTPSIVAFTEDGEILVGEIARRQIATNPHCTVTAVKRLMGKYYSDIEGSGETFPFELTHEDDQLLIRIRDVGYTPQQISALILKKLKDSVEDHFGGPVARAIITVPANFDDLQREATIEAGKLAGLEVERLINEPTAAAMAYGLGKEKEEVVAVYDFGGGTFDISILEVARNTFEVLTTTGDSHLGGEDIDDLLSELIARDFQEEHGVNLLADALSARRLKDAAEKAKCELSTAERTLLSVPFAAYHERVPLHVERRIARAEFEEIIRPIVGRTIDCCREALKQAGLNKCAIDKVILVGGSSRIPLVQDAVEAFFDTEPFKGVNPDEIVALGAATQGGVMAGQLEEVVLLDVTPHSLGVEVKNNRVSRIIEKNSTIPIKAAKTFTTTEGNQEIVNIHVLQGDEEEASRDRSLGRFTLTGIQAAPAGVPRIRVVFFINSDGVVEISATDLQSGAEKSLTVVHSFLTDEQYRAGRRAASRDAKRRRRRSLVRRPSTTLQGKALSEKNGRAEDTGRGGSSGYGGVREEPTFLEVDSEARVDVTSGARGRGARISQPAARTSKPPSPPPLEPAEPPEPPPGAWTPTVESISQQVEAMGESPVDDVDLEGTQMEEILDGDGAPATLEPAPSEPAGVASEPRRAAADSAPAAAAVAPAQLVLADLVAEQCPKAPDVVRSAARLLDGRATQEEAAGVYAQGLAEVERLLTDRADCVALQALAAMLHVQARNPEAANTLIEQIYHGNTLALPLVLALYSRLIDAYPQYVPALRTRGHIFSALGQIDASIADLESAVSRETSDETTLQKLDQLYRDKMVRTPSPALEFKQVKLYLKMSRLDDAISILQRLLNNPLYEQKALKILGLCFWQKNMFYLAWQKFKQLPLSDDIKSILYRLASDMEAADQLINAKYALERIAEHDAAFLDVEARLRQINHRLRTQQEDLAQTKTPASIEVLQDARFIILDEINRGSMGVVYRARDKVLDEIVAIKVLNDYLCADPQAVSRFKREARAAKRLSHPNIVRIHEFYESGGKKFISMEFIEGRDFKKILMESGRLPLTDIRKYFVQICRALQYAHDLDIVHRDIKPANIMITNLDAVKITDFGIAKILKTEDVTRSGSMIMGTPLYMAPEQIEGAAVDGRCDIYSLGIMLYEAIAGRPPFTEGNIEYQHVHTPVPALPESVPAGMRNVVYKCVEKTTAARFQSPGEFLTALEALDLS